MASAPRVPPGVCHVREDMCMTCRLAAVVGIGVFLPAHHGAPPELPSPGSAK